VTAKYIAIEGIDGSGKSTLLRNLKQSGQFKDCIFTQEPYCRTYRLLIQNTTDPMEKAALFVADRWKHLNEVVYPALEQGKHVISDRSYISNIAYQVAEKPDMEDYIWDIQPPKIPITKVIFLNVTPPLALERIQNRGTDTESPDWLDKVWFEYIKILKGDVRMVMIKPNSEDEITRQVVEIIREHLQEPDPVAVKDDSDGFDPFVV